MTPEQRKMARHALGLKDGRTVSYRNRYAAALGTTIELEWDEMVQRGWAERGADGTTIVRFCLTEAGAQAVLEPGERLDREDFPTLIPLQHHREGGS